MDLNRIKNKAQSKAQGFLHEHSDTIDKGLGKAEKFARSKTRNEGQNAKVDKVAGRLRGLLGDDKGDQPPATGPTTPTSGA